MAQRKDMRVTVLGSRGSVPVCGRDFVAFGGNTSCYLVEAGEECIILDAGSGLVNAPSAFAHAPVILLSHLHIDHLLGLGMYERLNMPQATTRLYVPASDARAAREALGRLYSPPLWPLELGQYSGDLQIDALPSAMHIGEVSVETAAGNHPDTSRLIRITFAGKSLVYATDFEHGEEASARLVGFTRDADLLLYDGQYDDQEYASHQGFGHSTPAEGVALMRCCHAKQLLIVHHDPHATDETLLARERAMGLPDVRFAREGEVIEL